MQYLNETIRILVVAVLAIVPAILWWWQIQKSSPRSKKNLFITFALGAFLSAGLTILIQVVWLKIMGGPGLYKELAEVANSLSGNGNKALQETIGLLIVVAAVGVVEEISKWLSVVVIGLNKYQIQSINDALRYSLASALGFAFAENIIYFWRLISNDQFVDLFATGVLRSTLLIAAHLIFSGIAGYYYGMSKFAKPLSEHLYWKGFRFNKVESLGISKETWFKYKNLFSGLIIAIIVHAAYNIFMNIGRIEIAFGIVFVGMFYIIHLLQQRGGRLVLGLKTQQKSTMKREDEEVVLELMGRWINAGKYKEVIEIGDRLLKRDPLNPVVHIFISEAYQKLELNRASMAIKALFTDEEYRERESIFSKKSGI